MDNITINETTRSLSADVDVENYVGWQRFVQRPPAEKPEALTRQEYAKLSEGAREAYDSDRKRYHIRFGPLKSTIMRDIHQDLLELGEDNLYARAGARQGAIIDGSGTLGKTTILHYLGRHFERHQLKKEPRETDSFGVRTIFVPVLFVSVPADTSPKALLEKLVGFYNAPHSDRATVSQLTQLFKKLALQHQTQLVLLDDIHNLHQGNKRASTVNDLIKELMNNIPATFVYAGINCRKSVLLVDELTQDRERFSQTDNRFIYYCVKPFAYDAHHEQSEWRQLLRTLEQHLMLLDAKPGFLEDHHLLLYMRTRGGLGALTNLVSRAANRSIRSGSESINEALLKQIKTPHASQGSYEEMLVRLKRSKPGSLEEVARLLNSEIA